MNERLANIRLVELNKELLRRESKTSLYAFTKYCWSVIEPETEFVDGWHIGAICEHLEAVTDFRITRLNINIPPRHMKSILCCVMWPAWVWGTHPGRSFIFGSNSATLAIRDSIKTRQVIESNEYRGIFKQEWTLTDDQNRMDAFKNTRGGVRKSVGVGTTITGQGGDYLVVDDPHDVNDIYSDLHRDKTKFWNDKTLGTRINDPKKYARVLIMQRLHEDDLSGHVLKTQHYEHINLPIEYSSKQDESLKSNTSLGFKDPRTKEGQVLWPERFSEKSIDELRSTLGEEADAQLNQDPKPKSGGLFPRDNWKHYDSSPSDILELILFIDAAQKPGVSNDYSIFATWARTHNGYYLLDLLREKTDAPLLQSLTENNFNKWRHNAIVIEDKSAGSSLIQYLRTQTTLPVLAFDPGQRDKVVRATAATPMVRSGKCYLPHEIKGIEDGKQVNLIEVFKKEHERFPKSKHDDMVDTTSMMVEHFLRRGTVKPRIRSLV